MNNRELGTGNRELLSFRAGRRGRAHVSFRAKARRAGGEESHSSRPGGVGLSSRAAARDLVCGTCGQPRDTQARSLADARDDIPIGMIAIPRLRGRFALAPLGMTTGWAVGAPLGMTLLLATTLAAQQPAPA